MLILLAAAGPAACGDAGGPADIDDPPAAPDLSRIAVIPPSADGVARVVGEAEAVEASLEVRIVNPDATARNGGTTVEARTTAAADGSFSVDIPAQLGDNLVMTAIEGGSESPPVTASSGPEPEIYTGQDLADVEMFLFANEAHAKEAGGQGLRADGRPAVNRQPLSRRCGRACHRSLRIAQRRRMRLTLHAPTRERGRS